MDELMRRLREEYETEGLSEESLAPDPITQFGVWFRAAVEAELRQPNAMVLSTVGADGRPSARAVLLKGYGPDGFVFYTNLGSRKGQELRANPQVALCFVWLELHRQVRLEGAAHEVDAAEADDYFRTRPHGAQVASAASPQSAVVESRADLDARYVDLASRYPEGTVPRPSDWTGVRVVPEVVEFWQGRQYRLHDRLRYRQTSEGWRIERLAP